MMATVRPARDKMGENNFVCCLIFVAAENRERISPLRMACENNDVIISDARAARWAIMRGQMGNRCFFQKTQKLISNHEALSKPTL